MSRREVLVLRVPAGTMKPEAFKDFREYVIESILRDVLVLTDSMTMSIEAVPAIGMEPPNVIVEQETRPETEEKPLPEPKAEPKKLTNREEKQIILDKLLDYRHRNGPGCFGDVARKTGVKSITADVVRLTSLGETTLTINEWRAIGRALDKLVGIEREVAEHG